MEKKLSIIEIARRMGISATTVSFILNGKSKEKRISDELTEKVLKFVAEIGEKYSAVAKGLQAEKTNLIILMVENISDSFFVNVVKNLEEQAYKNGFELLVSITNNDTEKTKGLLSKFESLNVDGYIIAPPDGIENELQKIINSGKPVMLFDRELKDIEIDSVNVHNYQSIAKAVNHLVKSGFKNIALITTDSLQSQMNNRLLGYEETLKSHHLPQFLKEISVDFTSEKTITHIAAFLQRRSEIDAIIFATSSLSANGLKAIEKIGLNIPNDIAFVGFEDQDLFELYKPKLTVIAQPIDELCCQMMSVFLAKLNGTVKLLTMQTIILESELIVRESSFNMHNERN